MELGLEGKIAVVTGGASGVGREIALSLAAEGAWVAVNYRSSGADAETLAGEIVAKGGKAKAYKADVADLAAVKAMVDDIVKDFGGLNILINNAGLAMRQRFWRPSPKTGIARSTLVSTAPSIAVTPPHRIWNRPRTDASSASSAIPRESANRASRLSPPLAPASSP